MFSTEYLAAGAAARRETLQREARTAGRARAARRRRASRATVGTRARQAVAQVAAVVAASHERVQQNVAVDQPTATACCCQ